MIQVPIDALELAHLIDLVANSVRERRDLEFKRDLPGEHEAAVKEFLADVTAMANAQGGDIVYGIEETGSAASRILGVEVPDLDDTTLRIESRIREGTDPRLSGVKLRWIAVDGNRRALVVRVPGSLLAPHCARYKGSRRFYSRASNGKYEMDTQELRTAFTSADQLPARIRALHAEAVKSATISGMPFVIDSAPSVIASVIPLSVYREARILPLTIENAVVPYAPQGRLRHMHMLEGVLFHTPVHDETVERSQDAVRSYALSHWQGWVDAGWVIGKTADYKGTRHLVWPEKFEAGIMDIATATVARFREYAIEGPWVILATVGGIKDYELVLDNQRTTTPTWRDAASLPECVVETISRQALAPLFRSFWLLFGALRPENSG